MEQQVVEPRHMDGILDCLVITCNNQPDMSNQLSSSGLFMLWAGTQWQALKVMVNVHWKHNEHQMMLSELIVKRWEINYITASHAHPIPSNPILWPYLDGIGRVLSVPSTVPSKEQHGSLMAWVRWPYHGSVHSMRFCHGAQPYSQAHSYAWINKVHLQPLSQSLCMAWKQACSVVSIQLRWG